MQPCPPSSLKCCERVHNANSTTTTGRYKNFVYLLSVDVPGPCFRKNRADFNVPNPSNHARVPFPALLVDCLRTAYTEGNRELGNPSESLG